MKILRTITIFVLTWLMIGSGIGALWIICEGILSFKPYDSFSMAFAEILLALGALLLALVFFFYWLLRKLTRTLPSKNDAS